MLKKAALQAINIVKYITPSDIKYETTFLYSANACATTTFNFLRSGEYEKAALSAGLFAIGLAGSLTDRYVRKEAKDCISILIPGLRHHHNNSD
ncbi:MAG: hypothetical protein J4431_00475 [Candidatus Aenigmarchaeota archaeon]|nr:hypothetical protein [Candidatus Aenigmarchaeota archaeon]